MCTIVVMSRVHPEAELVVAANRDEFYDRAAEPPQVLDAETGAVGGRDARAGGTWMGAAPDGFFVGLTNQRTWGGADGSLASRGMVALEALVRGSIDGVRELLEELDPAQYNPFNLIYGDHRGVEVAYARAGGLERQMLPAGVHVLTNDRIGSPDFPKAERARALAKDIVGFASAEDWQRTRRLLADHALPGPSELEGPPAGSLFSPDLVLALQALCIHTPVYGTRSATVIVANADGVVDYRYADGPPCEAPLLSVHDLFRAAVC